MKPLKILEFGLGQSSKMIHKYAGFFNNVQTINCEHDQTWINIFKKHFQESCKINKKILKLQEIEYNIQKTLSYENIEKEFKNQRFYLILMDYDLAQN